MFVYSNLKTASVHILKYVNIPYQLNEIQYCFLHINVTDETLAHSLTQNWKIYSYANVPACEIKDMISKKEVRVAIWPCVSYI